MCISKEALRLVSFLPLNIYCVKICHSCLFNKSSGYNVHVQSTFLNKLKLWSYKTLVKDDVSILHFIDCSVKKEFD